MASWYFNYNGLELQSLITISVYDWHSWKSESGFYTEDPALSNQKQNEKLPKRSTYTLSNSPL